MFSCASGTRGPCAVRPSSSGRCPRKDQAPCRARLLSRMQPNPLPPEVNDHDWGCGTSRPARVTFPRPDSFALRSRPPPAAGLIPTPDGRPEGSPGATKAGQTVGKRRGEGMQRLPGSVSGFAPIRVIRAICGRAMPHFFTTDSADFTDWREAGWKPAPQGSRRATPTACGPCVRTGVGHGSFLVPFSRAHGTGVVRYTAPG